MPKPVRYSRSPASSGRANDAPPPPRPGGKSINDLPSEILVMVLGCFQPSESWRHVSHLYNACLVASRWRAIAQPLLFNKWAEPARYNHDKHTLAFIRTLLDRPDLAALVETVCLEGNVWNVNDNYDAQDPADAGLLGRMLDAAERCRPGDKGWKAAIAEARDDSTLALMLHLLPQLSCLEFVVPYCDADELHQLWVMKSARHASSRDGRSTFLHNLTTIRPRHWDTEFGFNMLEISPLLMLPNLQTVEASALSGCSTPEDDTWPVRGSKVRSLILNESGIASDGIDRLLGSFEALEVLEWEWGGSTQTDDDPDVAQIGRSLRRHGKSLRTLFIDVSESYWIQYGGEEDTGVIGSLAGLEQLESVTLPARFLTGEDGFDDDDDEDSLPLVDIFPPALEELSIIGTEPRLPQCLLDMARRCASALPHLKTVRCSEWSESDPEVDRDVVRQAFQEAGVKFSLLKYW